MASASCFLHHHLPSTATAKVQSPRATVRPSQLICRAQKQSSSVDQEAISRRLALTALVGVAAVGAKVSPADAAYGESANVFGKPKTDTDFQKFNGDGFQLNIPSKWNKSKEVEFKGQVLRFEDNFDSTSNVAVVVLPTANKTITDFGSPEEFLRQFNYLLGKQAFAGKTASEGGFEPNEVATANLLEKSTSEVNGNTYYNLTVLTRTADGDEGGKHHLITAAVKNGKLYLCKAQAGDKRWFKGARRYVENAAASFSVA